MKHRNCLKGLRKLALAFIVVIITAGASFAMNVYLTAEEFTYQNTTPTDPYYSPILSGITMWGFALCPDDTFANCDPASVPGPTISVPSGDSTLNILLKNNLPAQGTRGTAITSTSAVIPGQVPLLTPGTWPTWTDGSVGPRADVSQRVRSFTTETAVGGVTTYTWTNLKQGTFLYQSGTHPGVQVQMGLFGAVTHGASTTFDTEVTLLFSEIDPELHYSVQSGLYGTPLPPPPAKSLRGERTSPSDYHPKYFLVNGEPYSPSLSPIPAGNPGQDILIRFLNAGLVEKTPALQNQSMTIIAEDGNPLPFSKEQYSLLLPAGKTMDAIFTPAAEGYVPVYDRSLNLTNVAASPGGARVYLQVGAASPTLTVTKDGTGTGTVTAESLPGGIDCGLDCSEAYITGTEIRLVGTPDPGSLLTAWSEAGCTVPGDCVVTVNADTAVTATFTKFNAIKVLAPKAGDVIPGGSTTTIWWGAPANAVKFRLRYSLNNGATWKTIASNVVGNTYSWSVPVPPSNMTRCLVKVIGFNAKGVRVGAGTSGKFTISVP
jgi:FtsP/CotA-like multicopper oxidase with cupredoxin domain